MRLRTLALCAAVLVCPIAASAQADEDARRKVDAALEALGGAARLRSLASVVVRAGGREHRSAEAQGYDPERTTDAPHEETVVAYFSEEKLLYEHKTGRHDGTTRHRRWSYVGDERTVVDFVEHFAAARRYDAARAERLRRARRVPHLLLLEAAANPANLTSAGAADYKGRRHDLVDFKLPNEKATLRLFLDAETRLLSKYEYAMEFAGLGDRTVEHAFDAYGRHDKLGWFPSGDTIKVGGDVWREARYTSVEVDSPRVAALFELPESLKAHLLTPGSVSQIAPGVFMVNALGGFNPLFVEFKDFVLAAEAPAPGWTLEAVPADAQPGASTLSEEFIRKIKETVPNKPIKYLVVTHAHSDHAGGARAFIAEGATVLTTTGNVKFFERMASATHALRPDRLAREPRPLRIEAFKGKRVVTDGERTVELIDVGPNPHTSENVIVHLPRERIVFQGDLFYFDGEATFPPRNRRTIMPFFARWLTERGLAPERIYGYHDRGFATMEHVRRVLAGEGSSTEGSAQRRRARARRARI
ncbi:MAG TPA: MBL fold metallo-hydrolase [Pyrinomonadaceae bacterium]|nr:MBL fold metallo-hydrolase [Pyrinomonadaceae bacterium]